MDIETYAKQSVLSRKILRWMVKNEMIENPLSQKDLWGLRLLEKTWCKREILRSQLRHFSRKRRLHLIDSADFETKWERYAFSRFNNLEEGKRLTLKKLVDEIEITFGFILNHAHKARLYKVRQRVYNKRKMSVKSSKVEA
ncbi:MAG: hypothetical protein GY702_21230 [Desulfobulbaceae bacterium]|nr:hypothetical protein [Desulfobulbaceae bacterium]